MYENSVNERPTSSRSSRVFTGSLATIWFTVMCFPTSRKNSSGRGGKPVRVVQQGGPGNAGGDGEVEQTFRVEAGSPRRWRDLLEGEQRSLGVLEGRVTHQPVPPPARAIGRFRKLEATKAQSLQQVPEVQRGAVGSKPM